MKHVTVSNPISNDDYKQKIDDQGQYIVTESGQLICTEDGHGLVLSQSKIAVYFGNKIAKNILEDALEHFEKEDILVPL